MEVKWQEIKADYNENPQRNPLRWACLKEVAPQVFENTTKLFKCKDYLNDFVQFKHYGTKFYQYGMPSNSLEFDSAGGAWLLLQNVTDQLEGNLKRCIAEVFKREWDLEFQYYPLADEVEGKRSAVLYVPSAGWTSTWRTSLWSLCIRSLNLPREIKDWDHMLDRSFYDEGHLNGLLLCMFKKQIINHPYEKEYIWWNMTQYHDKSMKGASAIGTYVHNCGILNWVSYLEEPIEKVFPDVKVDYGLFGKLHSNLYGKEAEVVEDDWVDEWEDTEEECEE